MSGHDAFDLGFLVRVRNSGSFLMRVTGGGLNLTVAKGTW